MIKLTWLSHGSWLIEAAGNRLLLDPFFTENPAASAKVEDFDDISHVLISHGHFDHVADAAAIAKRCNATIVSNFEIAQWFAEKQQVESTIGMNIGGKTGLSFGIVKMVPAIHSSNLPDGSYGGNPAGFVLTIETKRIYFACDTAYFGDMRFYAGGVDVAVLPIGDLYTMGIEDSVAAVKLIDPRYVLPAHYNTWPPIAVSAEAWANRIRESTSTKPVVLDVGASWEV